MKLRSLFARTFIFWIQLINYKTLINLKKNSPKDKTMASSEIISCNILIHMSVKLIDFLLIYYLVPISELF